MGTDITGWVEIKSWEDEGKWLGILRIWPLVGRNYEMFGSLFGTRNRAGFKPIAPERGLPNDISDEARKDFETPFGADLFGTSWITWSEIKTIDWEEEPDRAKYLLHRYVRKENGEITHSVAELCDSQAQIAQLVGLSADAYGEAYPWEEGVTWEKDGQMYKVVRLTRKTRLDKGWEILFKLMEYVALSSANKDSRLVVWFDS